MKLFVALAIVAFIGCSLVEGRSLFARDTKSTLITKGNDLIKQADEAIKKLETDNKTHEVSIIKSEEAKIKKLIADLEAATEATAISHIEHELTRAEHQLQFQLEKLNHAATHEVDPIPHHEPTHHVPAKRATKAELITKGNDLIKKADEAIVKLEADKKTHEAASLKSEEARIKKLIADLEAATEATAITHIQHELERVEERLAHHLEAITMGVNVPHIPEHEPIHHVPAKRATKAELITKGNDLIKKADEAIVKLEADKKTHEVASLKSEEARIKKLIADLEAATEATAITHIQHELERAEERLAHHLEAITMGVNVPHIPEHEPIHHVPAKRATKAELITKGNDLIKKADEAIVKLEAEKKTHVVASLKSEEARIKKLIADLEAATEATAITHLQHELERAEERLAHHLEAIASGTHVPHIPEHEPIHHVPAKRATKDALITKGNDLIKKADEAIKKLEADKKTHEATVLKTEEAKIKKLIADLEAATDDAKVKSLEHELSTAEHRLEQQLQKIAHAAVPPTF